MRTLGFTLIASVLVTAAPAKVDTLVESKGVVVIEVESTRSELGQWKKSKRLKGYTGSGYLEFTGNKPTNGPPKSPLTYRFKIRHSGLYYLHLRCARDTSHGQPNDHSNDCYVRVEGDYGAGPNAGDKHGNDAPLAMLKKDTKFYGGDANKFAWATGNRLDPGGHNNKRVAVYRFKAGQEYTLVVHGRSQWFSLDRIVFRHEKISARDAQDPRVPVSKPGK